MPEPVSSEPSGATVVVATLNRGGVLARTVLDLVAQTYRPLQVLIVDQSPSPSPEVAALAAAHPELVDYRMVDFRGLPQARNFGWRHAKYEQIIFVDDDVRAPEELVAEHMRSLLDPGVGVVAGGVDELSHDRSGRVGSFSWWLASPVGGFGAVGEFDVLCAKGCNFSARRSVLEAAGGIDELLSVGAALHEETEFCLRVRDLGRRVRFNGRARLLHLAAPLGGCRVREPRAYVRALSHNRAVLIRRHLKPYHYPTALGRLLLLGAAYARANHDLGVFRALLSGCARGMRAGSHAPRCETT